MVEGKDVPNDFEVPEDAVMIKRAGPWEFHFSKADYSLFVVTQRYAHLRVENLRWAGFGWDFLTRTSALALFIETLSSELLGAKPTVLTLADALGFPIPQ